MFTTWEIMVYLTGNTKQNMEIMVYLTGNTKQNMEIMVYLMGTTKKNMFPEANKWNAFCLYF
jgi:hypothetical protein